MGQGVRRLEVARVIGALEVLVPPPGITSSTTQPDRVRSRPAPGAGCDRCADREPAGQQTWSWVGSAFIQQVRAGRDEFGIEAPARLRVAVAVADTA